MNKLPANCFTLTPFFRKCMLSAHVIFSVGWMGAVAVFLVLAVKGVVSRDTEMVRAAYLVMDLVGWSVIVPCCFGSLSTGLILSLGSQWGLFNYYWVVVKLLVTVVSTIALLVHMQPIGHMAQIASGRMVSPTELRATRIQLIADAGAALLVLLAATIISVYKPWGKTGYGPGKERKRYGRYLLPVLIGLVLLFIIRHLVGGGLHKH